jgi:hypothetical protein
LKKAKYSMTDTNEFGEEVPECARILSRPPIDIRFIKDEDLYQEFRTRIVALLEANMVEAGVDGWRELAIKLAMTHEPAFQIITKVDPLPGSGRPQNQSRWGIVSDFRVGVLRAQAHEDAAAIRNGKVPAKVSVAQIAAQVVRRWTRDIAAARRKHGDSKEYLKIPSAKTLQNLASQPNPFPFAWQRLDHAAKAERVAIRAAQDIEDATELPSR